MKGKVEMKHLLITLGLLGLFAVMGSGAAAQSATNASWVGVWKGETNGLPSLEVVLADDGGPLGGTIVLYQVRARFRGDTPQILTQQPHVMLGPQVDGNTLTFRVRTPNNWQERVFSMILTADAKAHLQCVSCRWDIEIAREPLPKDQKSGDVSGY
jgi:hypothetical protein